MRRQHLLPFEERRARVHFLENHDEMRAMTRFGKAKLPAALVFTAPLPGLPFFQHGQSEGWRLRTPVQLARAPEEPGDAWCRQVYDRLFEILKEEALHSGEWSPWTPSPARSDSGLFGNRWRLDDVEWIALVNLGNAAERASLQPQFSQQFEVQATLGSREAPVVLQRQGNSIS